MHFNNILVFHRLTNIFDKNLDLDVEVNILGIYMGVTKFMVHFRRFIDAR